MRIYKLITLDIESGRVIEADWYEYDGPVAAARGEDAKAWNKSQTAKSQAGLSAAGGYGGAAAAADPTSQYKAMYANPMSTEEKAGRLSTVGGAYDAMGEKANERMARTGNSADYGAILDELARGKGRAMGQTAGELGGEEYSRKMEALKGLQGTYGTDVGAQTSLLRPGEPVHEPGFWDKFVLQMMSNANQAATMGAGG